MRLAQRRTVHKAATKSAKYVHVKPGTHVGVKRGWNRPSYVAVDDGCIRRFTQARSMGLALLGGGSHPEARV